MLQILFLFDFCCLLVSGLLSLLGNVFSDFLFSGMKFRSMMEKSFGAVIIPNGSRYNTALLTNNTLHFVHAVYFSIRTEEQTQLPHI